MVYGQWAWVRPGLSRPIDFGVNIFYVRKYPKLEFDGRCFWNGADGEQRIHYWCATEGEDWERAEKAVDIGDYWVVCDYQIIEERIKEAETKNTNTLKINTTWTTTAAPGAYITISPNGWENANVSTIGRTSDWLVQERFDAFLRQANYAITALDNISATHNEDEIQRWR